MCLKIVILMYNIHKPLGEFVFFCKLLLDVVGFSSSTSSFLTSFALIRALLLRLGVVATFTVSFFFLGDGILNKVKSNLRATVWNWLYWWNKFRQLMTPFCCNSFRFLGFYNLSRFCLLCKLRLALKFLIQFWDLVIEVNEMAQKHYIIPSKI